MIISSQKRQNKIAKTKKAPGNRIRVNTFQLVYHSFCRINQMKKSLYLIDIAKLDRYREKALGRYEGVPQKYFVSMKQENIYRHPAF